MAECAGTSVGPCPHDYDGDGVIKCQEDLFLCRECEHFRFPLTSRITKEDKENGQTLKMMTIKSNPKESECNGGDFIINSVLAYTWYAMQNSSVEKIKTVVSGFFTHKQIANAKNVLYENTDVNIIGEKKVRRTGNTRSSHDANVKDILDALSRLDKSDMKAPRFLFDACAIGEIPSE